MPYTRINPSAQLKPFVEFYYIWEHDGILRHSVEVTSPPNYCAVMVFNYGDPYQLFNPKFKGDFLPKSFLAGNSQDRFKLVLHGRVGMLGIVFKGAAYCDLISFPNPGDFANDRIGLDLLLGSQAELINEMIAEAPTHKDKIRVVEDFLVQLLKKKDPKGDPIDRAVDIVVTTKGLIKLDTLSSNLCMCPRNFRRRFIQRVGVSPKRFIRLKRFNFVNAQLQSYPNFSWQFFIGEGGYYDQSHLIRDFIEFTGVNPTLMTQKEGKHELQLMPENR